MNQTDAEIIAAMELTPRLRAELVQFFVNAQRYADMEAAFFRFSIPKKEETRLVVYTPAPTP